MQSTVGWLKLGGASGPEAELTGHIAEHTALFQSFRGTAQVLPTGEPRPDIKDLGSGQRHFENLLFFYRLCSRVVETKTATAHHTLGVTHSRLGQGLANPASICPLCCPAHLQLFSVLTLMATLLPWALGLIAQSLPPPAGAMMDPTLSWWVGPVLHCSRRGGPRL